MSSHDEVFYTNVYLLSKAVPTSKEFDSVFSKEMFRKQNTPGFMHVSHFLLQIYDDQLCKSLIPWPCICKQDETKFRKKFIELLHIIQEQNRDFQFPSGVAACLFQATGTKFMIIMKLLSVIVLRTYLTKNAEDDVHIPSFSSNLNPNLMEDSISLAKDKTRKEIEEFKKDRELAEEFMESQRSQIQAMKQEISKKEIILDQLIQKANIHAAEDRRKLKEYQRNEDVVESWRMALTETITYLENGTVANKKLVDELKNLSDMMHKIVAEPIVLDGNCLTQIEVDKVSELLDPQHQIVARRLYKDGKLVLTNFIEIFNNVIYQLWRKFQCHGFRGTDALCQQLAASSEDLLAEFTVLETYQDRCLQLKALMQSSKNEEAWGYNMNETSFDGPMSPICVQKLSENQKMEHEKKINLTPILKYHEHLFSKYKNILPKTPDSFMRINPVYRVNLDDSTSSFQTSLLTTEQHNKIKKLSKGDGELYKRYSRLFSASKRINCDSKLNKLSMRSFPKANSTPMMNTIGEESNVSAFLPSFIEESPRKCESTVTTQLESHSIKELHSPSKTLKPPEIVIENLPQDRTVSRNKRASIGDLVDRYKMLLKERKADDLSDK